MPVWRSGSVFARHPIDGGSIPSAPKNLYLSMSVALRIPLQPALSTALSAVLAHEICRLARAHLINLPRLAIDMSISAVISSVVGRGAGVAGRLAVLTHEFRFSLTATRFGPSFAARVAVVAVDEERGGHLNSDPLDKWDTVDFGAIHSQSHGLFQFDLRDGRVGMRLGTFHSGGEVGIDTSSPPASGGVARIMLLESPAISVEADLRNAMWIASSVTEQIRTSAVWILMGACGTRRVTVHLIGVRVGETVSVDEIWEWTHWGVAEVLPVGACWVVGGVGLLAEPTGLLQLTPELPEVVDEGVVHEEDGL